MAYNQHERHIGRRKGFEIVHRKHAHIIRAVGETAISTAYHIAEEEKKRREEARIIRDLQGRAPTKRWSVEYKHASGVWLTASEGEQGKTLEGAQNIVRANPERLRLMVWTTGAVAPVEFLTRRGR